MNILRSAILVGFLLGLSATVAFGESAAIGGQECDLWGPVSYIQQGGVVFSATINANWVNATCKWKIEDFDLGQALVRTYSGEEFNDCSITIVPWPNECNCTGWGQSTISASGRVTVKCQAAIDSCTSSTNSCPF